MLEQVATKKRIKRPCTQKDMVGKRFGRLVVRSLNGVDRHGKRTWSCTCDCGENHIVPSGSLNSGRTQSCGCLFRDRAAAATATHRDSRSPEFDAWRGMKRRCLNPKSPEFSRYGGRGISVCQRWLDSYEIFLDDMGRRPSPKHSIDRINNDGDYEPKNCRWATPAEQARNRSDNVYVWVLGTKMCLIDACELLGISYSRVIAKRRSGMSAADAVKDEFSRLATNSDDAIRGNDETD